MTTTLSFIRAEGSDYYRTEPLTPTDGAVTVSVVMPEEKNYTLLAEHSIDNENWQLCGSRNFVRTVELTVNGLRDAQLVRFALLAEPKSACYI
jgi:hypothetical protein